MKPEQITAWALDEASTEERLQLEAALLENPQDKEKAEETKAFCDFLLSELRDDSLALTEAQREKLKAQSVVTAARPSSGAKTPKPATKWRMGTLVRLAVAACVAVGGYWTWQEYSARHAAPQLSVAVAEKPSIKVQLAPKPDAKKKAAEATQARLVAEAQKKTVIKMEAPVAKQMSPASMPGPVTGPSALALNKEQRLMTPGDVEKLKQIQDQNAYALNFDGKVAGPAAEMPALAKNGPAAEPTLSGSLTLSSGSSIVKAGSGTLTLAGAAAPSEPLSAFQPLKDEPMQFSANVAAGSGALTLNGNGHASSALGKTPVPNLMGTPIVTTKSGTIASVAVTREFTLDSNGRQPVPLDKLERGATPLGDVVGTQVIAGNIVPMNGRAKDGGEAVALSHASGYTGSTSVTGGVAIFGTTTVSTDVAGNTFPGHGSVNAASAAAPASGTLALANGTSTAGDLAGTVGMTKTGEGTLVLGGVSTFTGGTKVNAGTLSVSSGAVIVTAMGVPTQMSRTAGAPLNMNGGSLATATPAAKPMVAGTVGSPQKPNAVAPVSGDLGVTASVGYDSKYVWRGNSHGFQAGSAGLNATLSPESSAPSTSFGYSFSGNSGSLANGGGLNSLADVPSGYGMNDMQQLTMGVNSNLGPVNLASSTNYDLFNGGWEYDLPARARITITDNIDVLPASATPQAGAAPAVAPAAPVASRLYATTDELLTFNSTAAGVQSLGADVRYFSLNGPSSVAMKDLEQEQAKRAFGKTDPTGGETYTRIIENEMKDVAREPLSTLSIDVDTASYANMRRFLNQNMLPPPDAVRIEELVNYFPTSEEGPAHEAKEPFGVRVELAPCPWQPVNRLARISIKGREMDKDRKASNLVFLVDVSGSMNEPAKLPLVQQSLRMLTEQLGEGDRVTMVVYAGSSGVVLPPTNGEKKAEILAAIDRLSAGGSTHGSAGIKLAYEQAVAGFIKGGVNRVILCTDGDFNVGTSSPEELEKLIKHKAKTGVFLSVLGFGSGNLKDRTMETLADKGNGNYAYIDSLSEARKVLVEQMSGTLDTIAKDVKIQVEFNPAAVRSYRLIGYENRLLAKEDFNDDTKDAGEIGAGHSVVALYEIVPANLPPGTEPRPLVDNLKYQAPAISPAQLAEAAKSGETMTVKLRYKEPDSSLSKLIEVPTKDAGKTLTASSEEFKFSAAVAGFGLLLRDSSYKGNLSWETVRRLALDGKGSDKLGYRGEFLQLIDKARGLKETR